jgi:hypothetical protein
LFTPTRNVPAKAQRRKEISLAPLRLCGKN